MKEMNDRVRSAVRHYWRTRLRQADTQAKGSVRDSGYRSAVTGGKQLDGFVNLLCELLTEADIPEACVHRHRKVELPGWFRAEKKWDIVIVIGGELIAVAELKSQVGPSFGNNFNNRTEEALGSATDILSAYREGAFRPSPKPWIGYLMMLEDCAASRKPVRVEEPHFKVFPEFKGGSYAVRYQVLMRKLVRDQLYDSAAFLTSTRTARSSGQFVEPDPELSFANLATTLVARAQAGKSRHFK